MFQETFSVMGDSGTAMRDPIFYRWHAYIDDLFQLHKGSLPRYTVARVCKYYNIVYSQFIYCYND